MAHLNESGEPGDEETLLHRLADGDKSAFWQLWLRHRDKLLLICLQLTRNSQQDAEDLLSDIMMKALEKLPSYAPGIRDLKSWLARLARNHCIDFLRKRQKEETKLCVIDSSMPEIPASVAADDQHREAPSLEDLLSKLSTPQQQVFVYRFIQGKSYDEISRHLNVPPAAIRKRVQRARDILRRVAAQNKVR